VMSGDAGDSAPRARNRTGWTALFEPGSCVLRPRRLRRAAVVGNVEPMGGTYTVQRSATIKAPADRVYAHIVDFHKWSAWSPWEELDPDMQRTFSGADAGVGAEYAWSGNRKVGEGGMEITDATETSKIEMRLEFIKPFKASSTNVFSLDAADGGTNVTWTMTGDQTFLTRIMGIFRSMDKAIGPDFEKGLAKLGSVATADPG